jgi:ATP-dependent Lon protease
VANLFYNIATSRIGLVGLWDAVAFDEVADLQKMPKEVVTTLKTYCESGTFARGKEQLSGSASIAMFGNTNQPVDVMVRSSHLFTPLPEVIREDMAFLDRIHSGLGNSEDADRDVHARLWVCRGLPCGSVAGTAAA